MKKILLLFIASGFSVAAMAQLQASTEPAYKNVLIEDLTGIHCGYCPDGAKRADEYKDANPGRVVIIANHCNCSYANTSTAPGHQDDVNFKTPEGGAIDDLSLKPGTTNGGYPAGLINRRNHAQTYDPGYPGTSRGYWKAVGDVIMAEVSPVNLAAEAYYRPGSNEITINVAGYYTENGNGSDYLTVAILQDNLPSHQSGASGYPARVLDAGTSLYMQMDVLRAYVTPGTFGEEISTTTQGTAFNRTYTYTPTKVGPDVEPKIEDMKVVVFMAEEGTFSDVITAIETDASERPVGIDEVISLRNVEIYPNPFKTDATVQFSLDKSNELEINVYDITGKTVYAIPSESYAAGNHKVRIDGTNLESGVYYVNVKYNEGVITRKLVLNK